MVRLRDPPLLAGARAPGTARRSRLPTTVSISAGSMMRCSMLAGLTYRTDVALDGHGGAVLDGVERLHVLDSCRANGDAVEADDTTS